MNTANRNTLWASIFVSELAKSGLDSVCIAPGSRSTPLAIAFSEAHGICVYTHSDERSAAYFALGLARASRKPVALVCTSGTAAANFFPAIVEANYGEVPLLVLTADRPAELSSLIVCSFSTRVSSPSRKITFAAAVRSPWIGSDSGPPPEPITTTSFAVSRPRFATEIAAISDERQIPRSPVATSAPPARI